MPVLYLTQDLFFGSRVTAAVRSLGSEVHVVRSAAELLEQAGQDCPLVLIDLDAPGADPAAIAAELRQREGARPAIVAFGSHVHEARLAAARDAGCDAVLTRGQFDRQMADILRDRLSTP
jgi:CheY-like chemotaxis protein